MAFTLPRFSLQSIASIRRAIRIENNGVKIMLTTDTINNLYDKLENYELDLAIIDASSNNPMFSSMLLDTDIPYVC